MMYPIRNGIMMRTLILGMILHGMAVNGHRLSLLQRTSSRTASCSNERGEENEGAEGSMKGDPASVDVTKVDPKVLASVATLDFTYTDVAGVGFCDTGVAATGADRSKLVDIWSTVEELYKLVHENQNPKLLQLPIGMEQPNLSIRDERERRFELATRRWSLERESIFTSTPGYYKITDGKRTGRYARLRERVIGFVMSGEIAIAPYLDRVVGGMMGMAVGDSLGAPLEFMGVTDKDVTGRSDGYAHYPTDERVEYNRALRRFQTRVGEWTDDTSMGNVMADNLILNNIAQKGLPVKNHEEECSQIRDYNGIDMRVRWWNWWNRGYGNAFQNDDAAVRYNKLKANEIPNYVPNRKEKYGSIGLGANIAKQMAQMGDRGITARVQSDTADAGNGSIMRLAPVPIVASGNIARALKIAEQQSYSSHPGPIAAECAKLWTFVVAKAIERPKKDGEQVVTFIEEAMEEYKRVLDARVAAEDPILVNKPSSAGESPVISEKEQQARKAVNITRAVLYGLVSGDGAPDVDPDAKPYLTEKEWTFSKWKSDWTAEQIIHQTLKARGMSYNGYPNTAGYFGSYAPDAIGMALNAIYTTSRQITSKQDAAIAARAALLKLVNFRGDADTTAAVGGQLVGAFYGFTALKKAFPDFIIAMQDGPKYKVTFPGGHVKDKFEEEPKEIKLDNGELILKSLILAYINRRYEVVSK